MLKSSRSSPRLKQVRGPSTPLGMRLAALRMTESEKSHSDDAAMCCCFEAAIGRLRSHAPARLKDCRAILEVGSRARTQLRPEGVFADGPKPDDSCATRKCRAA